jgi:hypothetical protein
MNPAAAVALSVMGTAYACVAVAAVLRCWSRRGRGGRGKPEPVAWPAAVARTVVVVVLAPDDQVALATRAG